MSGYVLNSYTCYEEKCYENTCFVKLIYTTNNLKAVFASGENGLDYLSTGFTFFRYSAS